MPDNLIVANNLGPLCAFLSSLTWAVGVTVYSKMSETRSPFTINFNRALVAFPFFLVMVLFSFGWHGFAVAYLSLKFSQVFWLFVSVVSSYAIGDVLFLMSTEALGVPAALAIASVFPVWSALVGWIYNHEVLSLSQVGGLMGVVTGVILVILSRHPPRGSEIKKSQWRHHYLAGVALALASSFFWSLNTFSVAQGGRGVDPSVGNTIRMGVALVLCPAMGWVFAKKIRSPFLPMWEFSRYFWVFAVEGFGGSLFFLYGLTHSKLAVASALSSLAPALSVPIALVTKTDKITKQKLLGIFLVVIGIWFLASK